MINLLGLSPRIYSWESIAEIQRPVLNLIPNTLACDLTWSDPDKKSDDYIVTFLSSFVLVCFLQF